MFNFTMLTSPSAAIDALVTTIEATFGRLDVVVNSAGVVNARPFASMSARHWHEMIDTNLTGAFHALSQHCHFCGRRLLMARHHQRRL